MRLEYFQMLDRIVDAGLERFARIGSRSQSIGDA